jgi:hypothetical protein
MERLRIHVPLVVSEIADGEIGDREPTRLATKLIKEIRWERDRRPKRQDGLLSEDNHRQQPEQCIAPSMMDKLSQHISSPDSCQYRCEEAYDNVETSRTAQDSP